MSERVPGSSSTVDAPAMGAVDRGDPGKTVIVDVTATGGQ